MRFRLLASLLSSYLLIMVGYAPVGAAPLQVTPARQDTLLREIELEQVPAGIALRSIGQQYGLNVSVQEPLEIPLTIHLESVSAANLFQHLEELYPLEIRRVGGIWHVSARLRVGGPSSLSVGWQNGRLEVAARASRVDSLAARLAGKEVMTLLAGPLGERRVTGYLVTREPEVAVRALLRAHGMTLRREGAGVYVVQEAGGTDQPVFELYSTGDRVTFNLTNAPLRAVLEEFARALSWDVFFYGDTQGNVTARATDMLATRALDLILVGTGLGVRLEGSALLIGDASQSEFGEVRLIRLEYLKCEGLIERLPKAVADKVDIQLVAEQNGIVATGPTSAINALESFVASIDQPATQILFETLVVDYFDESARDLGFEFGVGPAADSTHAQRFSPQANVEARGSWLKGGLTVGPDFLNLPVVGQLPDDFYVRLKALETEGKVRIRSRPQLATVNGNPATLTVGATQYFLIRSETTFAQQTVQTRISEQFETIDANMKLEITPWVTTSGEIITQIRPEFNTPQGALNAEVPPTINHRMIDTTVQLRDGQTIILGGLVQETTRDQVRRLPVLWRIPVLGRLFESKSKGVETSELMIYLTPHIYSGENQIPPQGGGL